MVVVIIMLLITSTILVRQARFDSSTLLRSLSYSIALTVRQAQVYGTSVRGVATTTPCSGTLSSGVCYASAYGVYFSGTQSYLLFADLNSNGAYDVGEAVQTYQVGAGFQISKFCATVIPTEDLHCSTDGNPLTSLTIYFKRPNPEALFRSSLGESYSDAYVQVGSLTDKTNTHAITISETGEVSVLPAGS